MYVYYTIFSIYLEELQEMQSRSITEEGNESILRCP